MRPGVRQPSGQPHRGVRHARERPGLGQLTERLLAGPQAPPWRPRSIRELDIWDAHLRGALLLGDGGEISSSSD